MSRKVMANVRSLKETGNPEQGDFGHRMAEVTIISHEDNNNVVAEYNGSRFRAIFNPFCGAYFVDDVDGFIERTSES